MESYLGINPPGLLYAQDALNQGTLNNVYPNTYTDTGFSLANGAHPSNPNSVAAAYSGGSQYLGEAHTDAYGGLQIPRSWGDGVTPATATRSASGGTVSQRSCHAAPRQGFPLGAGVLAPGENQQARRFLSMQSRTGVQHPTHIVAADTQAFRPMGSAPQYGRFGDALFNNNNTTQLFDRKHLTGVFVNTNEGKIYETYEDDLPPPNTDKSLDPEQLQRSNPKLLALQGGIDFNRPPPQKREVQLNMPGANGGSNPWGDALYAEGRRNREREIAATSVWGNRNGNFSVEPIMDGRPNGYVGFQNMMRVAPYVPPTQRGRTDSAWESPVHLSGMGAATTTAPLQQLRPYLKEVAVIPVANVSSETASAALRVMRVDIPDTMRSLDEGATYTGAVYAVEDGSTGQLVFTYETDLEETLRAAMERSANSQAAHTQIGDVPGANGGYVLERGADLMEPGRGDGESYQFITPVQVGEGHENAPFNGFCISKSARPEREMGGVMMPARAPEVNRWVMPTVACKKHNNRMDYQARAQALASRPTYMGEASVS